jgi:hypothetical protein
MRTAILLPLLLLPGGCSDLFDCANEVVARVHAPSGTREAVMFERNCGATTGFTTQISIVEPGDTPRDGGNVFIAEGGTAAPWGGPYAEMRWLAPTRLLVRYVGDAGVGKAEREVEGVTVTFERIADLSQVPCSRFNASCGNEGEGSGANKT